ncbi:MAG: hypothetical protein QF629_10185, partial [Alphaproteobacteria bacterium]|nr:hypothetical protein [Alphaproteobacteria bacterium]
MNKKDVTAAIAAARAKLRPLLSGAILVAAGFAGGWLVGIGSGDNAPAALLVHGPSEPTVGQAMATLYVPVTPEPTVPFLARLPGAPAYRDRPTE